MRLSAYFTAALSLLTAAAATGCGDNSRECGAGTHDVQGRCLPDTDGGGLACGDGTYEWMGQCVPYDPNDTTAPTTTADPAGGAYYELPSTVRLSSDEPAIIYYTTDGSTPDTSSTSEVSPVVITTITDGMEIKFFAVDPTGNTESVQTATYTVDQVAPGPVTNFAAADDGTDVTLTLGQPHRRRPRRRPHRPQRHQLRRVHAHPRARPTTSATPSPPAKRSSSPPPAPPPSIPPP